MYGTVRALSQHCMRSQTPSTTQLVGNHQTTASRGARITDGALNIIWHFAGISQEILEIQLLSPQLCSCGQRSHYLTHPPQPILAARLLAGLCCYLQRQPTIARPQASRITPRAHLILPPMLRSPGPINSSTLPLVPDNGSQFRWLSRHRLHHQVESWASQFKSNTSISSACHPPFGSNVPGHSRAFERLFFELSCA